MRESTSSSGSSSSCVVLAFLFIWLKLMGIAGFPAWSWLWVLFPIVPIFCETISELMKQQ